MGLFGFRNKSANVLRGTAGENIVWEYEKRSCRLKFSGSGEMSLENHFFKDYKVKHVEFDDEITSIGRNLLSWHNELIGELKLPAKLKKIEEFAFYSCKGLKGALNIPEGVSVIEDYAFTGCEGLDKELDLPEGLEYIGVEAFAG